MAIQRKKYSEIIYNIAETTYITLGKFLANFTRNFSISKLKKTSKKTKSNHQKNDIVKINDYTISKTKFIKKNKQQKILSKFGAFLLERSEEQSFKNFQCPICLEILVKATPTSCGHLFCRKCLYHALAVSSSCPICRTDLTGIVFVNYEQMDLLIKKTLTKSTNLSLRKNYQIRYREICLQDNEKKIKIECLEKGNKIDILDEKSIWRECEIKQLNVQNNGQVFLKVQYTTNEGINEQFINSKSSRLSTHKSYTKNALLFYLGTNQQSNRVQNQNQLSVGRSTNNQLRIQQFQTLDAQYTQMSNLSNSNNISQSIQQSETVQQPNASDSLFYNTSMIQQIEEQKYNQQSQIEMNQVFNFSDFADLQEQNSRERLLQSQQNK